MCCRVGKCCFCINLRAGVITFASIWLVIDALFLAWTSYGTHNLHLAVQSLLDDGYWWNLDPEDRHVGGYLLIAAFWMSVLLVILYSLAVPLDIMLLVGAITVRRKLVHGWVVAYAVVYLHFLVIGVINMAMSFYYDTHHGIYVTTGTLLHAALTLYFWIVVRSYYLELGQQYGEGEPRSTAGKVYRTVPTGDVLPGQGTYSDAYGMAMAPPRYTSSA